jgi:hypothetical protein
MPDPYHRCRPKFTFTNCVSQERNAFVSVGSGLRLDHWLDIRAQRIRHIDANFIFFLGHVDNSLPRR